MTKITQTPRTFVGRVGPAYANHSDCERGTSILHDELTGNTQLTLHDDLRAIAGDQVGVMETEQLVAQLGKFVRLDNGIVRAGELTPGVVRWARAQGPELHVSTSGSV